MCVSGRWCVAQPGMPRAAMVMAAVAAAAVVRACSCVCVLGGGAAGAPRTTHHATWPNARAGHVSWPSDHAAVRVRLAPALSIRTNRRVVGRRRRLSQVAAASLRAHGAKIPVLCVQTLARRCRCHCDRTRGGAGRLIRKKAGGDRGPEGSYPTSAEWRSLRFHCVRSSARTPHAGPQYM